MGDIARGGTAVDNFNTSFLILEGIHQSGRDIFQMLGDSRHGFERRLTEILEEMTTSDDDELERLVAELVDLGCDSPARPVFESIVATARTGEIKVEGPTLLYFAESWFPETPILSTEEPEAVRAAAAVLSSLIRPEESLEDGSDEPKGAATPRYLNAGFFRDDEQVPTDQPLRRDAETYRLGVNVGQFWGPGRPDVEVPEHVLEPHFSGPELDMQLAVRSFDVEVEPPVASLILPLKEDSGMVYFDLSLRRDGRQAIDIDLLLRGHLIQSRRLEFEVVADTGVDLPESAWPVQDGYTTFTRTTLLTPESLEWFDRSPRRLTVVAERDLELNRIGLRFYDGTGDELGFQQSNLSDASLTTMLNALRERLVTIMTAYAGGVGGSERLLAEELGQLAAAGRRFYLALLPQLAGQNDVADEGQRLEVDLRPGDIIQVAPLSAQLSVPWELLYERKIEEYREDRASLCATFREHGPALEDCPSHDDPTVVCPHAFWGYRYVIEQLPCRLEPGETERSFALPLQIPNEIPSRVNVNVSTRLTQVDANMAALRSLAPEERLTVEQVASLNGLRAALVDADEGGDIVYFYTHGGSDDFGSPYLEVGEGEQVKLIDLDAWDVKLLHQPLIFMNACESADYAPDSFENLIRFFCGAGAAGVVGTQCQVREHLALAFMREFFGLFFRQAPAGLALFDARRSLLNEHLDPRGLVYSLFAAAEVSLAQPISE
jgi:hypothetical protein